MDKQNKPREDYTSDLQVFLISKIISNPKIFAEVRHQLKPEYFDDPIKPSVEFIHDYADRVGHPPGIDLLRAKYKLEWSDSPLLPHEHCWLRETIAKFELYRATENVILDGIDLLREGNRHIIYERVSAIQRLGFNRESRFRPIPITEFRIEDVPVWLLPGLLFRQSIGVIFGPPGSLKSFLAVHLSGMLAHGLPMFGVATKPGKTLYVAGEGGATLELRRMAWLRHNGFDTNVDDGVRVIKTPVSLCDAHEVQEFIANVREFAPDLIVMDTYSVMIAGHDENAPGTQTAAIKAIRLIANELGCAMLIIHHPGKEIERGPRGHSSLIGNADMIAELTRTGDTVKLAIRKQKDGAEGEPMYFSAVHHTLPYLHHDGSVMSSLVCVEGKSHVGKELPQDLADALCVASVMPIDEPISSNNLLNLLKPNSAFPKKRQEGLVRLKAAVPEIGVRRVRTAQGIMGLDRVDGKIRMRSMSDVDTDTDTDTDMNE